MKTVKQIQNEIFTMYYQTPFKGLSKRQLIAPERCKYIVKSGLKPVVTEDWDKVLENAPAEYSRQILKNYLGFHC